MSREIFRPVEEKGNGKLFPLEKGRRNRRRSESNYVFDMPVWLIYVDEKVPLLTREEEVELAKQVKRGKKALARLENGNHLSNEEVEKLQVLVDEGREARNHFVLANIRLVKNVAKNYLGKGLDRRDLWQEGVWGVCKAVNKFDHTKNYKFSTYATWWIRQAIERGIDNQSRTIRQPTYFGLKVRRIIKASNRLEQKLGRGPTTRELAEELGIAEKKLQQIIKRSTLPVSLEAPAGESGDLTLGDSLVDESFPTPPQQTEEKSLKQAVREHVSLLTPREARILSLYWGLGRHEPHTLEQVGQMFGLTRERVRQIGTRAIEKLRHSVHARELRDYL